MKVRWRVPHMLHLMWGDVGEFHPLTVTVCEVKLGVSLHPHLVS